MNNKFPYIKITKKERDDSFDILKNYNCANVLTLSSIGNKASNYYFQSYRVKTKTGKWSQYERWKNNPDKIREIDKKIHRNYPQIIGTQRGLLSALRMSGHSVSQFKPYIAICGVYETFKPKRVLDPSAGWGDRLIAAMSQDIDYIGIDQNKKLKVPYTRMINDFKDKTKSDIIMIFKRSQDVDYSKLPKYDLIFTSPPYFNLEQYEGMEVFKDKDDFLDNYWRPTILNSFKYLEKGGHLALNIPDEMYNAIKKNIGRASGKIIMPLQNRFNYKKENIKKFEYIYYWKK